MVYSQKNSYIYPTTVNFGWTWKFMHIRFYLVNGRIYIQSSIRSRAPHFRGAENIFNALKCIQAAVLRVCFPFLLIIIWLNLYIFNICTVWWWCGCRCHDCPLQWMFLNIIIKPLLIFPFTRVLLLFFILFIFVINSWKSIWCARVCTSIIMRWHWQQHRQRHSSTTHLFSRLISCQAH